MDLDDLEHNVRDGVHIAALAAVPGQHWSRALGACACTAARSPLPHGSHLDSDGSRFVSHFATAAFAWSSLPQKRVTACSPGQLCRCNTMARPSRYQ